MKLIKSIKKLVYKFKINLYINKNYKVIFPPQGLGDILILLMGLKVYKKQHPKAKIAIIVTKKHFKDLCEIFYESVDKILYFPNIYYISNKNVLNISNLIYSRTSHFDRFEKAILDTINVDKINIEDIPRIEMNKDIEKLFYNKYKISKTILLSPEATTSKNCFNETFWLECADKLKEKGYIPIFNSSKKYGEYDSILLNLKDTINFTSLAQNVISFRSGLSDVLACFCNVKHVVIYPNNCLKGEMPYLNGYDENPNEKYMEDSSLNRLYPNKKFIEFIYQDDIDVTSYFEEV